MSKLRFRHVIQLSVPIDMAEALQAIAEARETTVLDMLREVCRNIIGSYESHGVIPTMERNLQMQKPGPRNGPRRKRQMGG